MTSPRLPRKKITSHGVAGDLPEKQTRGTIWKSRELSIIPLTRTMVCASGSHITNSQYITAPSLNCLQCSKIYHIFLFKTQTTTLAENLPYLPNIIC